MDLEVDKEAVFHLLDLILNSYILLISCGSKLSHRDYRLCLVKDLLKEGGRVLQTETAPQEMPDLPTSWLEARHILHWPG
jgi:hypothetical protein